MKKTGFNPAANRSFAPSLPEWFKLYLDKATRFDSLQDRMSLAIELAERNVAEQTGGPFGAAIFDLATGELVAPGVNLVLFNRSSLAHAEIVSISLAQARLHDHNLGSSDRSMQLVTTTEPCAMCMGAIPWSGIKSLVCGARDADARAIGFDEGPKPVAWQAEYEKRGIEVIRDIERDAAVAVLEKYKQQGGTIYNG